jgi:hypothetical protein
MDKYVVIEYISVQCLFEVVCENLVIFVQNK